MACKLFFRLFIVGVFYMTCALASSSIANAQAGLEGYSSTIELVQESALLSALSKSNSSVFFPNGSDPVASSASPMVVNPNYIHVPADIADFQSAINQISDGGTIELSPGTYSSPVGGFHINDMGKGFTIKSAPGATVVLDGGGARDIFRFINSNVVNGRPVIFQGLTFANGWSQTDGIAGGVTLQNAQASFLDSIFQNNVGIQNSTGGGGVLVAINSTAFFINSRWNNNTDRNYGGGLAVEAQSKAYIFSSRFTGNRTNVPYHLQAAAGGAIHVGNSLLRVSNSRFENNQAGYVGGGIYAIGEWAAPISTPRSDVIITNSTFINNQSVPDPTVSLSVPSEGGAVHSENQTTLKVYNSRFITNNAQVGGALTAYRSIVEIHSSVFQGNRATGSGPATGFGGAISAVSNDTSSDGSNNWRSTSLTVDNTLFQGRYGTVTTVAQSGGGIYVAGDYNRTYGANGVVQMGSASSNLAILNITNTVFNDLDVQEIVGAPGTGVGGGIVVDLTSLNIQNSLIMNSDALGSTNSSGGGIALLDQSVANITGVTLAHNTSGKYGAGVFVQGSTLNLSNSNLIENALSDIGQGAWISLGAAIFASPDISRNLPVSGVVSNNLISNNVGLPIFDDDRDNAQQPAAINSIRYDGNRIYSTTWGNQIYTNSLGGYCCKTVSGLNSLTIQRPNTGTSTTKSGTANIALTSAPIVGVIIAVPPSVLATNANGDSVAPTTAYVGYAWSGGAATLDGSAVLGNAGLNSYTTAGTHTVSVGGTPFTATINQGITPNVTSQAIPSRIPSGSSTTLRWSITGTFTDVAIDQGVTVTSVPSGSVQVAPVMTKTYNTFALTQEGGSYILTTVIVGNGSTYSLFLPLVIR